MTRSTFDSDARTNQLTTVPFHYVGVVSEFPTAPKDSFFVANAAYITARTGNDAAGAFLVDTGGQHTTAVAATGQDPARPDGNRHRHHHHPANHRIQLLVPHVGHQHRPGDRRPRFGHHPGQQVELLGPQFDLHAAQARPAGGPVDLQRTDPDHVGAAGPPAAAGPRRRCACTRANSSASRNGLVR